MPQTNPPTPIEYNDLPVGRIGPRGGGTASLVVTPAAENGGTIGLYVFEAAGGNSWPLSVQHGLAVQIGGLAGKDGASVQEILRKHEDLIREIDTAYLGTRWSGSDHVGVWKPLDDVMSADEPPAVRLSELLEGAASYWDADDWLSGDFSSVISGCYAALAVGRSVRDYAADEVAGAKVKGALVDREEVERIIQEAIDEATTEGWCGVDLAKVCAFRFAALRAAGKSEAEAAEGAREALSARHRDVSQMSRGVVREGRFVLRCECGVVEGDRSHDFALDEEEAVVILEWMPEHLRASHAAAGNCGAYPHNRAHHLVVLQECADRIVIEEGDDRWARIVGEG